MHSTSLDFRAYVVEKNGKKIQHRNRSRIFFPSVKHPIITMEAKHTPTQKRERGRERERERERQGGGGRQRGRKERGGGERENWGSSKYIVHQVAENLKTARCMCEISMEHWRFCSHYQLTEEGAPDI